MCSGSTFVTRLGSLAMGAVLVTICLQLPAGGASSALPAYLTPASAKISLNEKWLDATRVSGIPGSPPTAPNDPAVWVWANRCGPDEQSVTFSRIVEMLGPPLSAEVANFTAFYQGTGGWRGLKSFEFDVNDKPVFKWTPTGADSRKLSSAALQLFKLGPNQLTVRATRFALPKGVTQCNAGGQPYIGLNFVFSADFFAELRASQPTEVPAYRIGTRTTVSVFVENKGPDRSVDGELFIYVGGEPADVMGGMKRAPAEGGAMGGGTLCPKDPGYATQAHCHFDHLDPGERMYVLVGVHVDPKMPNWDYDSAAVTYTARSQTPYWNGINESQQRIVFCRSAQSSLAGCKSAK